MLAGIGVALACLPALLGCFLPDSALKFRLAAAGNIWLGIYFYLFLFCIIGGIACYAWVRNFRKRREPGPVCARALLILAFLLCAAANIYGTVHATDVKVHKYSVSIDKPFTRPDAAGRAGTDGRGAHELRVVLIADFHMSVNSKPETIRKMAELVNQQDADLVFAAGDFLTSTFEGLKNPEEYAENLRTIRSGYGTYAVYGNHDVEEPLLCGFPMTPIAKAFRSAKIPDFIRSCGFEILSDEVTDAVDGEIVLVCREDGEKTGRGAEKRLEAGVLMSGIDRTKPVFVLEHEPVDFRNLADAGADLVFSGHTHAGQVFPLTFFTKFYNKNNYGLKSFGSLQSIVTSGVGFFGPPLRVGSDSEIMVLDIRFSGE